MVEPLVHQVIAWQKQKGRHGLPWQNTKDAYRIWLSEIMLQQTQVSTVIDYYQRFLKRFPTVFDLAQATQDEVMSYWAGLGYYARARNLHLCAQKVVNQYNGQFPKTVQDMVALPGIGRSTAHAILAFSDGQPLPIMDGNVKRVFSRFFGVYGVVTTAPIDRALWKLGYDVLGYRVNSENGVELSEVTQADALDMTAYTQGLMDLGATICTRKKYQCEVCPLKSDCYAYLKQVQAHLPTPKPSKKKKEKQTIMLFWSFNERVYLERRPNQGIWGGLWSFPEFNDQQACHDFLKTKGVKEIVLQPLAPLSHQFTHFTLHIQAYFCSSMIPHQQEKDGWYSIDDLTELGTPKPVSDLLGLISRVNEV